MFLTISLYHYIGSIFIAAGLFNVFFADMVKGLIIFAIGFVVVSYADHVYGSDIDPDDHAGV